MGEQAEEGELRLSHGIVFKATDRDADAIVDFANSLNSVYIIYRTASHNTRLWIRREAEVTKGE